MCLPGKTGHTVVALRGDLDMSTAEDMAAMLAADVPSGVDLVMDLSAIDFMDSSGIALLINTSRRTQSMKIEDPSPSVRLVIEATGLTEVLGVRP